MKNKPNIIAVIPARGGSKRILNKNIRNICGKPMIQWVLEELKKTKFIKDIIVSTDSHEIKKTVETLGIKVPFLRPSNISDDFTSTSVVTKHALKWYEQNISKVDYVITIYPTAIFTSHNEILMAYKKIINEGWETVFTATTFPFPIQRAFFLNKKNLIQMFQPEMFYKRSQDLTEAYHDAGQFYFSNTHAVLNETPAFSDKASIILLPRHKAIDIDTEEDFIFAEKLLGISNKIN